MADTGELRVRAFVEELDAVRVQEGMTVKVTADAWPNKSFPGRVISCSPHMVPKRHLSNEPGERIDVKVREVVVQLDQSDARDRLVVGLPVDVYLQVSRPTRLDLAEQVKSPTAQPCLKPLRRSARQETSANFTTGLGGYD